MMTTQRNSRRPFLCAWLALAAFSNSASAFGQASPAQAREQREKEIAGKTEAERARLQRNFKAFRDLAPAEQERLLLLDKQLNDDARNQGNLRAIMNQYYDWLATLTPGQQDDLRKENDPNRREKRVRELLKEQQERADATGSEKGPKSPPKLSANDLAAVLGEVEKAMREKGTLSQEELQQLENKRAGLARHGYILELAFPLRPRPGQRWFDPPVWSSPAVIEKMIESISNEKQVAFIEENQPSERGRRLFGLIFSAIRAEYDKIKPDQEALERFFVQLSSAEQDEIMHLPFDQQQQKLMHTFLQKKSEEDPDNYPRMPAFLFGPRRQFGPRPGPRPGSEQRGGDRGASRKADGPARIGPKDRKKQVSEGPSA